MSDLLALTGLLTAMNLVLLVLLWLLFYRQAQQIRHLGGVSSTLARAWKESTGQEIRVDPMVLGTEPDVVTDEQDTVSQTPESWEPWEVK